MIAFRNIVVQDYKQLDLNLVKSILFNNLIGFPEFTTIIFEYINRDKIF